MQLMSGRLITFFFYFFVNFSIVTAEILHRSVWVKHLPGAVFTFFHTQLLQLLFPQAACFTLTCSRSVIVLRTARTCSSDLLEHKKVTSRGIYLSFLLVGVGVEYYSVFLHLLSFSRQ